MPFVESGMTFDTMIACTYVYDMIGLFDTHLRINDSSVYFYDLSIMVLTLEADQNVFEFMQK